MKTAQFYKYATWLLLTLNLSLIAFFFLTKPGGPPGGPNKHNFRMAAVEMLQLDKEQEAAFVAIAQRHSEAMDELSNQENSLLKSYFEPLLHPTQKVDNDSLMTAVLDLEKAKIEGTFQHFAEVRNILDASQIDDFEIFMRRALGILLLEQQKNAPPPQD